jgi:hypothetical protein
LILFASNLKNVADAMIAAANGCTHTPPFLILLLLLLLLRLLLRLRLRLLLADWQQITEEKLLF